MRYTYDGVYPLGKKEPYFIFMNFPIFSQELDDDNMIDKNHTIKKLSEILLKHTDGSAMDIIWSPEFDVQEVKHKCTCDTRQVLDRGCICGGE
jgi:hypothetical protein